MKIKLAARPSDLLFTTRELDVFFIVIWAIYAGWGYVSVSAGVPTISQSLGLPFNIIWSAAIAVAATVACIAGISLFFQIPHMSQVRKKRVELSACGALFFLTAIYPVYLGITSGSGDGRTAATVLALLYPTIVFFRIRNLLHRVRNYPNATR